MPRRRNEVQAVLNDLRSRLDRIVTEAVNAGRTQALTEIRALVGDVPSVRRGPGRPPKVESGATESAPRAARGRPRKRRRNPWAHMSAEQRQDRIRKMLAGRGLKPKAEKSE